MEHAQELMLVPRFTEGQLQSLADPAYAVDHDGRILAWNPMATLLLGWPDIAALGTRCSFLLEGRSLDGWECHADCTRPAQLPGRVAASGGHPDLRVRAADGSAIDVTIVEFPILLDGLPALLHVLRPVSRFQRDPLTGLVGRGEAAVALAAAQSSASRTGEPLSAALVDVDHLKRINDRYGHAMGDRALQQVATTLSEGRRHDHVARWGGDEFLLLAQGATPEATVTRLQRCIAVLRANRLGPHSAAPSISAGVTEVDPTEVLDTILARADAALYQAKRRRATVGIAPSHRAGVA